MNPRPLIRTIALFFAFSLFSVPLLAAGGGGGNPPPQQVAPPVGAPQAGRAAAPPLPAQQPAQEEEGSDIVTQATGESLTATPEGMKRYKLSVPVNVSDIPPDGKLFVSCGLQIAHQVVAIDGGVLGRTVYGTDYKDIATTKMAVPLSARRAYQGNMPINIDVKKFKSIMPDHAHGGRGQGIGVGAAGDVGFLLNRYMCGLYYATGPEGNDKFYPCKNGDAVRSADTVQYMFKPGTTCIDEVSGTLSGSVIAGGPPFIFTE